MTKYFLISASRDHVMKGVQFGIAQAGHGKRSYIGRPGRGDWLVFYSAREKWEKGKLLQKFTAIGQVKDEEPYQAKTPGDFKPYRRKVEFKKVKEAEIRPLLEKLSFIKNPKRWGFYLMSGFREISKEDFETICGVMT